MPRDSNQEKSGSTKLKLACRNLILWPTALCTITVLLSFLVPKNTPTVPAGSTVAKTAQAFVASPIAQPTENLNANSSEKTATLRPTVEMTQQKLSTSEPTATNTARPTSTRRPTVTPFPSRTPIQFIVSTPLPTFTPRPTNTLKPPAEAVIYYTSNGANLRTCAKANDAACPVGQSVVRGQALEVTGQVEGDAVNGNTVWYEINWKGESLYVSATLLSRTKPAAPQVQPTRDTGSTNQNGGATNNATNPTPVPPEPTAVPVQPTEVPADGGDGSNMSGGGVPESPAGNFACDCSRTCGTLTCEEAYFQLNSCGCSERDADSDGVPCESVCSGG